MQLIVSNTINIFPHKFEHFKFFFQHSGFLLVRSELAMGPYRPTDQKLQQYEINQLNSLTTLININ